MKTSLIRDIKLLIATLFIATLFACGKNDTFTDIDGNEYHSIRIGNQIWMAENLRTTRFNNGDLIAVAKNASEWTTDGRAAYSNYANNDSLATDYGLLYNWYCISDKREIAPKGWRIPTEADLRELLQFVGSDSIAASLLKERGTQHWLPSFTEGNNATGFSALPGGYKDADGQSYMRKSNGYYWTTQGSFEFYHWSSRVFQAFANIERDAKFMKYGFSIKCIKDISR